MTRISITVYFPITFKGEYAVNLKRHVGIKATLVS